MGGQTVGRSDGRVSVRSRLGRKQGCQKAAGNISEAVNPASLNQELEQGERTPFHQPPNRPTA